MDYLHFNPVKHGYVASAFDWPHSTLHRLIRQRVHASEGTGSVTSKS